MWLERERKGDGELTNTALRIGFCCPGRRRRGRGGGRRRRPPARPGPGCAERPGLPLAHPPPSPPQAALTTLTVSAKASPHTSTTRWERRAGSAGNRPGTGGQRQPDWRRVPAKWRRSLCRVMGEVTQCRSV